MMSSSSSSNKATSADNNEVIDRHSSSGSSLLRLPNKFLPITDNNLFDTSNDASSSDHLRIDEMDATKNTKRKSKSKSKGFYIAASSLEAERTNIKARTPRTSTRKPIQEEEIPHQQDGLSQPISNKMRKKCTTVASSGPFLWGKKLDQHFAQEEPQRKLPGTTIATDPTAPLSPSESTSSLVHSLRQHGATNLRLKSCNNTLERFVVESSSSLLDMVSSPRPSPHPPAAAAAAAAAAPSCISHSPGWMLRESRKNADATSVMSHGDLSPTKSTSGGRRRMLKNSDTSAQLPDALQLAASLSPKSCSRRTRKLRVAKKLDKDECRLRRRSNSIDQDGTTEKEVQEMEKVIEEALKNTGIDAIQRLRKARSKKRPTGGPADENNGETTIVGGEMNKTTAGETPRRKSEGDRPKRKNKLESGGGDKRAPHNRSGVAHHTSDHTPHDRGSASAQQEHTIVVDRIPNIVSWHARKEKEPSSTDDDDNDDLSAASFNSSLTPSVESKEFSVRDDYSAHDKSKRSGNAGMLTQSPVERLQNQPEGALKEEEFFGTSKPGSNFQELRSLRLSDSSPAVPQRFTSIMFDDFDETALQVPEVTIRSSWVSNAPSDEDSLGQHNKQDAVIVKPERHPSDMPSVVASARLLGDDSKRRDQGQHGLEVRDSIPFKPEKRSSVFSLATSRSEDENSTIMKANKDSIPVKPVKQISDMSRVVETRNLYSRRSDKYDDVREFKDTKPSKPEKKSSDLYPTVSKDKVDGQAEGAVPIAAAPSAASLTSSKKSLSSKRSKDSAISSKRKVSHGQELDDEKKVKLAAASEFLKHKISQMNELRLKSSSSSVHSSNLSVKSTRSDHNDEFDFVVPRSPRRSQSLAVSGVSSDMKRRSIKKEKAKVVPEKDPLKKERSKRSLNSQPAKEDKGSSPKNEEASCDSQNSAKPKEMKKKRAKDEGSQRSCPLPNKSEHSASRSKSVTRKVERKVSTSIDKKDDAKVRSRSQSPNGKGKRQPKSLLQPEKLAPWQIKQHRVTPLASLYYNRSLDDDEEPGEDPYLPSAFRVKTDKPKTAKKPSKSQVQGTTTMSQAQLERKKRHESVMAALGKSEKDASDVPPAFRHLGSSKSKTTTL